VNPYTRVLWLVLFALLVAFGAMSSD